jgi:outer membrane receptor protein involved in Fe transport
MLKKQTARFTPFPSKKILASLITLFISSPQVFAGGAQTIETIIVTGTKLIQVGVADSANEGTVSQQQLEARTVYRPGELLEATPGLIVSQHSGEGKANQFYLRGFNLDHGTDLRTTVDGMLVNERTHAHGQGWTDLNFLIPELASKLEYKKGPYYASEGDFSSAGAVSISYLDTLAQGIASIGVGQNGFKRAVVANSSSLQSGNILYGLEVEHNDGPFVHPDDFRKLNGVLRYSDGDHANGMNVTAMAYQAKWNSSDQIPQRAIDTGLISGRYDALDPTDGGKSHRYSLSSAWNNTTDTTATKVNAYFIDYKLDLYSDFTYFLDNPIDGDQFNQPDKRYTTGLNASQAWQMDGWGEGSQNTLGAQFQNDNIFNGLYDTRARQRLATTRQDHVLETSLGIYFENATRWTETFRTVAGIRDDYYHYNVNSNNEANSGTASDTKASPKLSMIFGPWDKTEFYVNLGAGFHSNDARGTTITIDPKSGAAADKVTPLVRSTGEEIGVRTEVISGLQSSLTFYELDFDSELIFEGDAGSTAAGRPSRRDGFELANYYTMGDYLTLDADIAFARARFKDNDPAGNRIPGSVEGVASLALALDNIGPYFGAVQLRYFGPRPLIEDNSVRSNSTATVNARVGYKLNPSLRVELEAYNLTNRSASAIDYYYQSRLPGEPAQGVNDIHFHPIESRSLRMSLVANF